MTTVFKGLEIPETGGDNIIELLISNKLTAADYRALNEELCSMMSPYCNTRLLINLQNFQGEKDDSGGENLDLDTRYFPGVKQIAVVGDGKWQETMSQLLKPFTAATVRYFDSSRLDEARSWNRRT